MCETLTWLMGWVGTGRHTVNPSDSIQTTTAVTALVASAGAHHKLLGGAPCVQGTDDVDADVSGFAAARHRHINTRSLYGRPTRRDSSSYRTRTELARRASSVSAPSVWNDLLDNIRLCITVPTFKKHLKTLNFSRAFMST